MNDEMKFFDSGERGMMIDPGNGDAIRLATSVELRLRARLAEVEAERDEARRECRDCVGPGHDVCHEHPPAVEKCDGNCHKSKGGELADVCTQCDADEDAPAVEKPSRPRCCEGMKIHGAFHSIDCKREEPAVAPVESLTDDEGEPK